MPDILVFEKDITSGTLPNPIVLVVVVFPHCYDEMTPPYSQHNSRMEKSNKVKLRWHPHIPNIKVIYMEESKKVKLI